LNSASSSLALFLSLSITAQPWHCDASEAQREHLESNDSIAFAAAWAPFLLTLLNGRAGAGGGVGVGGWHKQGRDTVWVATRRQGCSGLLACAEPLAAAAQVLGGKL